MCVDIHITKSKAFRQLYKESFKNPYSSLGAYFAFPGEFSTYPLHL